MQLLLIGLCIGAAVCGYALYAQNGLSKPIPHVVILLGPPGSGKGTQAVRLSKELALPHISTGDLFRENMSQNSPLGQEAKSYIEAGKLVPDSLVLKMLFDRVKRPDSLQGYLLDGFPRTLAQAEALEQMLPPSTKLTVLELDVPDHLIVERIAGRLSCAQCGNVHHRLFSPPSIADRCDKCGGVLTQRRDDQAHVVEERLRVYHEQTKPLVDFYSKKGILQRVDGTKSPDEVFRSLQSKL